jgi:hypothetical protein
MWTDGWTVSHDEPYIRFSEICEVLNTVQFILFLNIRKTLTNVDLTHVAQLDNDVTDVVTCYDVVPPIPDCCKSDIS